MSGSGQGIFSLQAVLISLAIHAVVVGGLFSFGGAGGDTTADSSPAAARDASGAPASSETTAASEPEDTSVRPEVEKPEPQKPEKVAVKPVPPVSEEKKPVEIRIEPRKDDTVGEAATKAPESSAEKKNVKTRVYVVSRGDTLTALARECGLTISELAELNGKSVKKLSNLKIGQRLKLPAGD